MLGAIAVASLLVALQNPNDLNRKIAPISVQTLDAQLVTVPDRAAVATVLVFLLADCPIANRYAPEIKRIEKEFSKKGVVFLRVYVFAGATPESIQEHTRSFGYKWPAIHDKDQELAKAVRARVTPEVAVINPDGAIEYQGRIDDMYIEHGRLREADYRRDLRIALGEIVAGKPVTLPRTPAIGCFIEP